MWKELYKNIYTYQKDNLDITLSWVGRGWSADWYIDDVRTGRIVFAESVPLEKAKKQLETWNMNESDVPN